MLYILPSPHNFLTLINSDGSGSLAYQEFARKFANYKATASLHREVNFKNDKEALAEKLHGSGAGARMTKSSVARKKTDETL